MSAATITVALPNFAVAPDGGWPALPELARAAEDAGADRVAVVDHVVMGAHAEAYSWGAFPFPPEAPWLDPLTTLAAMAAVTTTVRLMTAILVAPLRATPVLAKSVATIDVLSDGRVDLGVGTGWQRGEFDACGLDFERRGELLTDTIAGCRELWTRAPASFSAPTVAFEEIWCRPSPRQARVPVWFSGSLTSRNVDRIIRLGDGWLPIMDATDDEIARDAATLRVAWTAAGREGRPAVQMRVPSSTDAGVMSAHAAALVAAGATDVRVVWRDLGADAARIVTRMREELPR